MAVEEDGDTLSAGDAPQAAERLPAGERRELADARAVPHFARDQAAFGEDEIRPHGDDRRRQDEHRRRPRAIFRQPHARMRHHIVEEAEIEEARRKAVEGEFGDVLLRGVEGLERHANHGHETRQAREAEHPQAFREAIGRDDKPPDADGVFAERLAYKHKDERDDRVDQNGRREPGAAFVERGGFVRGDMRRAHAHGVEASDRAAQ